MNLRLLKMAMLFLMTIVVSDVWAQGGEEDLFVIKNESQSVTFLSRFEPVIGQDPLHGTVEMVQDPIHNYTLTYTPDQDYLGNDEFLLVSFPFDVSVSFRRFKVMVKEADIRARHDFGVTAAGTAVSIPVLDNDFSNVGTIELVMAPVVNAGTAEVVDNEIVFTPNPGFVGLTDLNYVICVGGDQACDLGTVSINVLPGPGSMADDTVQVFTIRDQPQFIFAPEGATAISAPLSGTMVDSNGVMAYLPNEDFIGEEYLAYSLPGSEGTTVFHVTVLDLERNRFASEDRAYTAVDASVRLNVLSNDLYSVFADCVTFGVPQFGSVRETGINGQVEYTPPANWSGVDRFSYSSKAPGCNGEAEVETVYVFVSNFAPASGETMLTTPAGTPVDITYETPGGEASWTVLTPPSAGTVVEDPVTGQLSYLPLATAAGQTDQLTLTYCLNEDADGNCGYTSNVTVTIQVTTADANACVEEDCVWPGDTNNDGVVDVGDLLPIGLAMGRTGTPRLSGTPSNWSAQYSESWEDDLNGLDLKHIDANGDQVISSLDTQVVMANLGLAHRLRPELQAFSTFELSLRGSLEAEPGDRIVLDILAGNNVVITEDVYGFRFPFVYDPANVDPSGVEVVYDESSWASYDSPILSISNNNPGRGVLNTAMTRTNGEGISGFGKIGTLSVVITEDVYGFHDEIDDNGNIIETTETILGGEAGAAMTASGHLNAVRVNPYTLRINRRPATEVGDFSPVEATNYLEGKLQAYPNPTSDRLVVHLNGQQRFSSLQLTDLTGRTLINEQGLNTNHRELTLGQLPNGIYTLTLTTEDGVVNRKVEVLR